MRWIAWLALGLLSVAAFHHTSSLHRFTSLRMASNRVQATEVPYIENVLDKYAALPDLTYLALGSSHWSPPKEALEAIQSELFTRDTHRYGSILGYAPLREKLLQILTQRGLETSDMDLMITAGANQAIMSISLALCDASDTALVLTPCYLSHLLALQLCQAQVIQAPFLTSTLQPDFDAISVQMTSHKPKMVVLTTPNNPSGYVWPRDDLIRLAQLCKAADAWLVVDQTYYEFLYDGAEHVFPSATAMGYDKIISIFSLSKVFGMPGWRVGYAVFPKILTDNLRKIQDTMPTHATILSQKLGYHCLLSTYKDDNGVLKNDWFSEHLHSLERVRDALWPVLEPLGTVRTNGAFYFLVPVPQSVTEDEAVDILARQYGVLLMHGSPFGAKDHLRLSYGSIPPEDIVTAIDKLRRGFAYLQTVSAERNTSRSL